MITTGEHIHRGVAGLGPGVDRNVRLGKQGKARSRLIVLGWVNDTDTKRAYGSKSDAYRVFQSMLASGHPPYDWDQLLQEATQASERLQQLTHRLP